MMTVLVEMRGTRGDAERSLTLLESLGARRIPGYAPIPMNGADGEPTIVLTVEIDDRDSVAILRGHPQVVGVFGDSPIEPFEDAKHEAAGSRRRKTGS